MGKRKRRMHSPKYATKYATLRAASAKARGVIDEAIADGVITEEEAVEIVAAQDSVLVATEEMMEVGITDGIKVAPEIKTPTKKAPAKPKKVMTEKPTTKKKKKTTTKKKGTDA